MDEKPINRVTDEPEKPALVNQRELCEIGPVIRTEAPEGDESEAEMKIRAKHNARRDAANAARDYQNGSIDHEEFDRRMQRARFKLDYC